VRQAGKLDLSETWGINVINVEIRAVEFTDNIVRRSPKQKIRDKLIGHKHFIDEQDPPEIHNGKQSAAN
jgi:hypothetical protein